MSLKPCPFCGDDKAFVHENAYGFAVLCDGEECAAEGPICAMKRDAAEAWNRRPTVEVCGACGISEGHTPTCPIFQAHKFCPSCGLIGGQHTDDCGAPR